MSRNPHGKYLFLENYVLAELGQSEIKNWQRQVLLVRAKGEVEAFEVAAKPAEKKAFFEALETALETWERSEMLIESYKSRGA